MHTLVKTSDFLYCRKNTSRQKILDLCFSIYTLLSYIYSTEETLFHLHLSCQIAEDMYINSLRINRAASEGLCMHLLLYCVDSFNTARKSVFASFENDKKITKSLKTIQEEDTSVIIKRMLTETQDWLRRNYCFWNTYTVRCLNVSMSCKYII